MSQNLIEQQADIYLRQHRIQELFEDITTAICFTRPVDLKSFLVQHLQLKQTQGFKNGLYSSDEISNIFTVYSIFILLRVWKLFDLRREGYISKSQAKDALKTMAESQFQLQEVDEAMITEKVTRDDFLRLVEKLLGLKTKK